MAKPAALRLPAHWVAWSAAAALVLASAAVCAVQMTRLDAARAEAASAGGALEAARTRLAKAEALLAASRRDGATLAALIRAGVTAPLAATQAVDRIDAAIARAGLSSSIEQHTLSGASAAALPAGAEPLTAHSLSVRKLVVQARPMHEHAFLSLWDALDTGRSGLSVIERCDLERPPASASASPSGPGPGSPADLAETLIARCEVSFYSFLPNDPPAGAASAVPGAPGGPT